MSEELKHIPCPYCYQAISMARAKELEDYNQPSEKALRREVEELKAKLERLEFTLIMEEGSR